MAKAADWLREERRKVLGDWVAFCLGCGAARRWFEEFEADVPDTCSQCGGELLRRCKGCGAPFSSIAVVDFELVTARDLLHAVLVSRGEHGCELPEVLREGAGRDDLEEAQGLIARVPERVLLPAWLLDELTRPGL